MGYYSKIFDRAYYDGYGYNFYYETYGYYEYSVNPSLKQNVSTKNVFMFLIIFGAFIALGMVLCATLSFRKKNIFKGGGRS